MSDTNRPSITGGIPLYGLTLLLAAGMLITSCRPDRAAESAPAGSVVDTERAFPGAQGWGANTAGGRGGEILRVTTLERDGPGSFRQALETEGPRIIVFEVGGVIDLDGHKLELHNPHVTIAGQTAPSPGITFIRGGLSVETHDVIIQHIRIRTGEAGHAKESGWEINPLTTRRENAYNIIVDQSSFTWGTDENLSASGPRFTGNTVDEWRKGTSRRITFSNNIIAECLSESTHSKGEHSKGTLLHDNVTDVLVYNNLFASNVQRNPLFKGGVTGAVVNNYIFNAVDTAVDYHLTAEQWEGREHVTGKMSLVGNVMRFGPDSPDNLTMLIFFGSGDLELYEADNLAFDRDGIPVDIVRYRGREDDTGAIQYMDHPPIWPDGLEAAPASGVEEFILANAGARPWDRDEIDARIIREVREGTNRVIHSEDEAEGYPQYESTYREFNPDEWDLRYMTRRDNYGITEPGDS